ncbi:MAG: alpha/beta hydrolase [Gammaproteobacteria bacterium]
MSYEDVRFHSGDGVGLHGWFLPASGKAAGTLVFLHGNAENISTHFAAVHWLPEHGFDVFIFDYRGFGLSEGAPHIKGAHQDVTAALRYVRGRKDVDPDRLILFGQSIGGAMALYAAATSGVPLRAVVSESAFASYPGIMREKMSKVILTWPLQWMALGMTSKYDPIKVIDNITVPLLLIHGDHDPIVPVQHAHRLYASAQGSKHFWVVDNGGHIDAFAPKRLAYRLRFTEFLRAVLRGKQETTTEWE